MQLIDILLLIYFVYLPSFLGGLVILISSNPQYSFKKNTVSELAFLKHPRNMWFNLLTFSYGFLALSSVVKFAGDGDWNFYRAVCSVSLLFVCMGTMLEAVFPLNINKKRHFLATGLLFVSLIVVEGLFSGAFLIDKGYLPISVLSFLLLVSTAVLVVRARRYICSLGDHQGGSEHALAEWLVVLGTLVWNMLFVATLLSK